MTVPAPRPPIPGTRQAIADEAKRCAATRADVQNAVLDGLARIDALTQRIEDLVEAMTGTPA